jgi:hypothetical protein
VISHTKSRWDTCFNGTLAFPDYKRSEVGGEPAIIPWCFMIFQGHRLPNSVIFIVRSFRRTTILHKTSVISRGRLREIQSDEK